MYTRMFGCLLSAGIYSGENEEFLWQERSRAFPFHFATLGVWGLASRSSQGECYFLIVARGVITGHKNHVLTAMVHTG